ncbi:predicted GPI-anchored protein 58 [Leopardus geoffroyi]|uniref:predicted GPI-anchored protein 58 n=1 Tax=Leopardus geoffroyi TaxID=46844 RepID=UPI001E25E542|nr:predicted GPI-anchored protein 58 [Leopardus geoffroyi]
MFKTQPPCIRRGELDGGATRTLHLPPPLPRRVPCPTASGPRLLPPQSPGYSPLSAAPQPAGCPQLGTPTPAPPQVFRTQPTGGPYPTGQGPGPQRPSPVLAAGSRLSAPLPPPAPPRSPPARRRLQPRAPCPRAPFASPRHPCHLQHGAERIGQRVRYRAGAPVRATLRTHAGHFSAPVAALLAALRALLALATVLGNSLIVVVFAVDRSLRSSGNFLLNLAVADLLVGDLQSSEGHDQEYCFRVGGWWHSSSMDLPSSVGHMWPKGASCLGGSAMLSSSTTGTS